MADTKYRPYTASELAAAADAHRNADGIVRVMTRHGRDGGYERTVTTIGINGITASAVTGIISPEKLAEFWSWSNGDPCGVAIPEEKPTTTDYSPYICDEFKVAWINHSGEAGTARIRLRGSKSDGFKIAFCNGIGVRLEVAGFIGYKTLLADYEWSNGDTCGRPAPSKCPKKRTNDKILGDIEALKALKEQLNKPTNPLEALETLINKALVEARKAQETYSKAEVASRKYQALKTAHESTLAQYDDLKRTNEALRAEIDDLKRANADLITANFNYLAENTALKKIVETVRGAIVDINSK